MAEGRRGEIEPGQPGGVADGGQDGTFAFLEGQALAEGPGNHQDVAEKDGGVEAVAADGLEGDFRGELRGCAEAHEVPGVSADFAVFGEVASGLAHEPERRRPHSLSTQHAEEGLGHRTASFILLRKILLRVGGVVWACWQCGTPFLEICPVVFHTSCVLQVADAGGVCWFRVFGQCLGLELSRCAPCVPVIPADPARGVESFAVGRLSPLFSLAWTCTG